MRWIVAQRAVEECICLIIFEEPKDDERFSLHFAREITYEMEMAASSALAGVVTINDLCKDHIIPDALDKNMAPIVAKAVSSA